MKTDTTIQNIGAFAHKKHGTYFLWFDHESNCYGISRSEETRVHCRYFTLASLFTAKGF